MIPYVIQRAYNYLSYLLTAQTKYSIHSPFIYRLVTEVLEDSRYFYSYEEVERIRYRYLQDSTPLAKKDYGSGSDRSIQQQTTIKNIAQKSSISPKYGRLLFRLANYYQPLRIIELGTSLGISTLYLAKAKPSAHLITIEGAPAVAQRAQQTFRQENLSNIEVKVGRFKEVLPNVLEQITSIDLLFIDGNHRRKATQKYFELCLPYLHNNSLLILDDIHHSHEMEQAWEFIRSHARSRVTINLFQLGLVFFRQEQAPQNFTIRF